MALPFYNWSRTASSNANADSTVNWAEGQAPSSVNDSARNMMASTAAFRDDISGSILTTTSTTAYVLTSYQVFDTLAHMNGQLIAFTPHGTNTNTVGNDVTLNVDGLGAKPIRMQSGVALPSGTLIAGTPYLALYNNSDAVFYLHGLTNPYAVPLGGLLDYIGTTAPNSAFALPIGQAISRTTYATLFSLIGTTYGTGDGSTTFNVPDLTGRVTAMKEASATRLTSTYFGGNSTVLGATGGSEKHQLTTAQLASHTHVNTLTDQGHVHSWGPSGFQANVSGTGASGTTAQYGTTSANTGSNGTAPMTINNVSAGSDGYHNNTQPTIIVNKILRVI